MHLTLRVPNVLAQLAVAVGVAALGLVAPTAAGANASISRTGNTITIVSNAGSDGILADTSTTRFSRVRYRSSAGLLTPGRGCTRVPSSTLVDCGPVARNTMNLLTAKVTLGAGNDTFRGHVGSDRQPRLVIDGGPGNDVIAGTDSRDDIDGGAGRDSLYGLDDTDGLDGGPDADTLFGGNGNDAVDGGTGQDHIYGDVNGLGMSTWGADVIVAYDAEPDVLHCGAGFDVATLDASDTIPTASCEGLQGGQNTPPIEHPEGTLPLTMAIGAPTDVHLAQLVNGSILHFAASFSAPAFVSGRLEVTAAEARRVGLGRTGLVLADDVGIPLTVIPITVNAQMRMRWAVRPALVALRARPGFTSLRATIVLRGTDVNNATSETRRPVTLVA